MFPLFIDLPIPHYAYAEVYMTDAQAVAAIFPGKTFTRKEIELTDAQKKQIEDESGETIRAKKVVVFVDAAKNAVFIDQVLGKHEFITLAVGITSEAKVQNLEILEYRETYGQQVRQPAWRDQFHGKDKAAPLKVDKDIKNISGATLSSVHVTGGVRRLLRTYDTLRNQL